MEHALDIGTINATAHTAAHTAAPTATHTPLPDSFALHPVSHTTSHSMGFENSSHTFSG